MLLLLTAHRVVLIRIGGLEVSESDFAFDSLDILLSFVDLLLNGSIDVSDIESSTGDQRPDRSSGLPLESGVRVDTCGSLSLAAVRMQ